MTAAEMSVLPLVIKSVLFGLLLTTCLGQFQRDFQRQPVFNHQRQDFGRNFFNSAPRQNQFEVENQGGFGGSCPERNGRYPTGQCDKYIECQHGVPTEKLCPDGLVFNPNATFGYPCSYPIDVDCLTRSALQPAQPTDECPHQYGYFKIGDERNCGKFINCVDGRAFSFECPEGLAYDSRTYRCNWPDQVADCDAEAFLGFTCPPIPQTTFLNSEARFYRSPVDCQKYFICIESRPRLQSCGVGNAFNELTGSCDAAENVTGCALPNQGFNDFQTIQLNTPQQIQNNRRNQQFSRQRFSQF